MSKFSNINWAAFLLGGMWGNYNNFKIWGTLWLPLFLLLLCVFLTGFTLLGVFIYFFMAAISAHLALQGNRMLSSKIHSEMMEPEIEDKERMIVAARQRKLAMYGLWSKPYYFYFLIGLAASIPAVELQIWLGLADSTSAFESHGSLNFAAAYSTSFTLLAIDVVTLICVLILSRLRGDKENILYSGGNITGELIARTPMKCGKGLWGRFS